MVPFFIGSFFPLSLLAFFLCPCKLTTAKKKELRQAVRSGLWLRVFFPTRFG